MSEKQDLTCGWRVRKEGNQKRKNHFRRNLKNFALMMFRMTDGGREREREKRERNLTFGRKRERER